MPVPVPTHSYQQAYPADKLKRHSDPLHYNFATSPSAFTKRGGINRVNSRRSSRPRRIWEAESLDDDLGFRQGLTSVDNAHVIKGARAQACLPPISSFIRLPEVSSHSHRHSVGIMAYDTPLTYPEDDDVEMSQISPIDTLETYPKNYGIFSPVLEGPSPEIVNGHAPGSSPIGPVTPFGDFIDRALAGNYVDSSAHFNYANLYPQKALEAYEDHRYHVLSQVHPRMESPRRQGISESAPAPTATTDYRILVDALSEWLACYVWRVCITGAGLPQTFCHPSPLTQRYPRSPPTYLAESIRSVLLSTLLQPSAIFLSLWYITRLPVYLGPVGFGPDFAKETAFRAELLGEDIHMSGTHAPFRVFLLGCMLANKWLDDHTFSNKTWHSISNVPVRALNRLEFCALNIFRHDLSISPHQWKLWLSKLTSYHSSPFCPQPISRPSTDPHIIIKRALETLLRAPIAERALPVQCPNGSYGAAILPEPVFLGLEERKRERMEKELAAFEGSVGILDIDLDEDGPLREEYLPRRRIIHTKPADDPMGRGFHCPQPTTRNVYTAPKIASTGRTLPPPARWSPSGDELMPIPGRYLSGLYMAPQAGAFHQPLASSFSDGGRPWELLQTKCDAPLAYGYDLPSSGQCRPAYDYGCPPHGRSHSLYLGEETRQPAFHVRSHSQVHPGYGYPLIAPEIRPFPPEHLGYYGHPSTEELVPHYSHPR